MLISIFIAAELAARVLRLLPEVMEDDASQAVPGLVLAAIVVLVVVGRRMLQLSGRVQTAGAPETSAAGAAICPKCKRPFARSFLSPNLVVGKLCRCPHCGKWSVVPRATAAELAAAEAADRAASEPAAPALSEEERLRRKIDASKYE